MLKEAFAEIFASLDECPREETVTIEPTDEVIDGSFLTGYRRRWIAEHPVPLKFEKKTKLLLIPTTGNRVKVRIK